MNAIEREIMERVQGLNPEQRQKVLAYVRAIGRADSSAALVSEDALGDWLSPEEDSAWEHLQQER
jgi:transcriptional accessory protein Tex/SPT6